MKHLVWKVRHKLGDKPDYFSFSIKREGYNPLPLTANQFSMLFPEVKTEDMPEAPETGILVIQGTLA